MAADPNANDNSILTEHLAHPVDNANGQPHGRQVSLTPEVHPMDFPQNDTHTNVRRVEHIAPEQNPELLHWRANRLLDEMMLGAIDIAANDSVPARALASSQGKAQSTKTQSIRAQQVGWDQSVLEGRPTVGHKSVHDDATDHDYRPVTVHRNGAAQDGLLYGETTGAYREAPGMVTSAYTQLEDPQLEGEGHGRFSSYNRADSITDDILAHERRESSSASSRSASVAAKGKPQPRNGTEQWLFAAEQRYEQLAARHQTERENGAGGYDYDGWSIAGEVQTVSVPASMAPPHSRENNFERLPSYDESKANRTVESSFQQELQADPAVRPARKNLRSNLLPRMNTLDSRAVQQEMALLQSQIEAALADGHESRVRAQHLLQKASTILIKDPTRSAEVDYYIQQVRMIVRRVQETAQWSDLYKHRLQSYLLGWLALSLIFIVSRYLYAEQFASFLARLSSQNEPSLLVYNLLTIATAFFFGALGGGIGALVNVARHMRQGYGFFDRKFGLRGLILPLIGALSGIVLCVFFGLLYALFGVEPFNNLWFGLIPALLALVLGASQEYFYGTITP